MIIVGSRYVMVVPFACVLDGSALVVIGKISIAWLVQDDAYLSALGMVMNGRLTDWFP